MEEKMKIPDKIFSGYWKEGHVQGIAVDEEKGYVYYSFTTFFLKTDFSGTPVGSVRRLAGHLGCITFDADRRRVYGSLEMKHDAIGKDIVGRTGWDPSKEDAFYLASFDVDKIDRMGMDAETDGVMSTVWLADPTSDYKATDNVSGQPHRYGCSGIDGTAYGPAFGAGKDSARKIMVAYGVYGDVQRRDNDYQVILQYDPKVFETYGRPLNQERPHHSGPESCEQRYFFYTGNTVYGVQNLEYDAASETYLTAVYRGQKEEFTNFPMFFIDARVSARWEELVGRGGEKGAVLTQADLGESGAGGIRGIYFSYGQTGVYACGDGTFCFSQPGHNAEDKSFCSTVVRYEMDRTLPELFRIQT